MVGLPRKVRIGLLSVTPAIIELIGGGDRIVTLTRLGESIHRFQQGDWGNVDQHDAKANDTEMETGGRILAVYSVESLDQTQQVRFYIIHYIPFPGDGGDEGPTTILLPSEY